MREGCQRKISIYLVFVVARRVCIGVSAGVVILVVCEELASILFCCGCSSDAHEDALLINRTCPVSDCRVIQLDLNFVSIAVNSVLMAQILKIVGGSNL